MTDCKHTCRNCKHWASGYKYFNMKWLMTPTIEGGAGWTDPVAGHHYLVEARRMDNNTWDCEYLKKTLDVDLDQGRGWDAGGASVDTIGTPGDFGCINWEFWDEA